MLSVIIPTRNRAALLKDALESICVQSLTSDCFEVLVIDNASTDNTRLIVEESRTSHPDIHYIHEEKPGLHNGRHRGAQQAKGEVLVFVDDDIIAAPGWLKAIHETFKDPAVALAGGKILPKWEGDVPRWIELFTVRTELGWTIGNLSLLDFGDMKKDIPAGYVYGCNFSIRKSVLFECGGFHPDAMPQELIRYRGDGESALSRKIMEKGYRIVYEPDALVYHRVPKERLTADYFCRRAFNQGISDSFTEIRRNGGVLGTMDHRENGGMINRLIRMFREKPIQKEVRVSYLEGKEYHRKMVESDPEILDYVLRETYF